MAQVLLNNASLSASQQVDEYTSTHGELYTGASARPASASSHRSRYVYSTSSAIKLTPPSSSAAGAADEAAGTNTAAGWV